MTKDPAFLMYSKDWLEGTAEYMPEEKGVYIDLLCHQQQRGGLPIDIKRLAKMVGLGTEEFTKIWDVISCNFIRMDDRLVNRKLQGIVNERAKKSKVNYIIGVFAGLLRVGKYTILQRNHLKSGFEHTKFIPFPKEEITERLSIWILERLKSIEDGTEDEDYSSLLKKVCKNYSIQLSRGFYNLILEWLKYKSEKHQTYKEQGLRNFITKLMTDCGSDLDVAKAMLLFSTANNYTGLFKENRINTKNKKQNEELSENIKRQIEAGNTNNPIRTK